MSIPMMSVGRLTVDQVEEVLLAATAAPSLHNGQPWRFRCTSDVIELHADHTRSIPVADTDHRELILGCGAALLNLRLAIRALAVHPEVRTFPDPNSPHLLAIVRPDGRRSATELDQALAAAIHRRHTSRQQFAPKPVPALVRDQLRRAAEAERAWLAFVDPTRLPRLRALASEAHRIQLGDPEFAAEWAYWTGRRDDTRDGVPVHAGGPAPARRDEWLLRDFSGGQSPPPAPAEQAEPHPLIMVLGSFQDTTHARLQAGQAMQRVLLTATTAGLSASFVSQVLEVPTTRKQLRTLIGGALWPQTVLRLGYGPPVPATPRRALADVVVDGPHPAARGGRDQ